MELELLFMLGDGHLRHRRANRTASRSPIRTTLLASERRQRCAAAHAHINSVALLEIVGMREGPSVPCSRACKIARASARMRHLRPAPRLTDRWCRAPVTSAGLSLKRNRLIAVFARLGPVRALRACSLWQAHRGHKEVRHQSKFTPPALEAAAGNCRQSRAAQSCRLACSSADRDIAELHRLFDSLSYNKAKVLLTYWSWRFARSTSSSGRI